MTEDELLTTGEFARRAEVTVRTLRYYDREGLLRPRGRARGGRRLYGARELVRLQQVLTLKFLGFPLVEIGRILATPDFDLARALAAQRQLVDERLARMQRIIRALDRAQTSLAGATVDWDSFTEIIRAVKMEEYEAWGKKYYSEEQQAKLAERAGDWTPAQQEVAGAEWGAIGAETQRLIEIGADPAGPEAQTLAARQQSMIDQFTQGDAGIEASLCKMWSNWDDIPAPMRGPDRETFERKREFVGKMMAEYKKNR